MKSGRLLDFECINCGRKAWSLRDITTCSKCGATVVCTSTTGADQEGKETNELLQLPRT